MVIVKWLPSFFIMSSLLTVPVMTLSQTFPSSRITVVVPFPPAGGPDVIARLVNGKLSENLKLPVIIENRPGAGSMVGSDYVKKAAPTGYTLLHASATFSLSPSLYVNSTNSYDPARDFQPITQLVNGWAILMVPVQSTVRSVADLVALGKQKPKGLSFGSAGSGTGNHLLGEMFRLATGLNLVHVPYKGSAPALQDMVGNSLDFMFDPMSSSVNLVRSGKLRAIGFATRTRTPVLPDVPTMAETGYPSVELDQWQGVIAPKGTPRDIVAKLQQEYVRAVRSSEVQGRIEDIGVVVSTSNPEDFQAQIEREIVKLGKLVKDANIKVE